MWPDNMRAVCAVHVQRMIFGENRILLSIHRIQLQIKCPKRVSINKMFKRVDNYLLWERNLRNTGFGSALISRFRLLTTGL
jgi:hypothetical protein